MKNLIPYGSQLIDKNDISAVTKALKQPLITSGPLVNRFEKSVERFLDVKHVLSCNSGTSALMLAFLSLEIKENDKVIIPSINFVASFNILKSMKAKVYLCDVDPKTAQMTPKNLIECIKRHKLNKIKAIVRMYHGGYCDENMEKFQKLKQKYKFKIIEDACHAFGSAYKVNNKMYKIGSCKNADISTFSLHPLKTITSGEGGLVSTNNKSIYNKMKLYRSHGILRSKKHWHYDVIENGYNFRLSDLNCALGLSQLKKTNSFIKKRKAIYEFYQKKLKCIKELISFPLYPKFNQHSYHLALVNISFDKLTISKDDFFKKMLKNGIMCQYHYRPIYKFSVYHKYYRVNKMDFKNSEKYHSTGISLPMYCGLSKKKLIYVINNLVKLLRASKK